MPKARRRLQWILVLSANAYIFIKIQPFYSEYMFKIRKPCFECHVLKSGNRCILRLSGILVSILNQGLLLITIENAFDGLTEINNLNSSSVNPCDLSSG